jgi:phosphoesterase RecJ-like protein
MYQLDEITRLLSTPKRIVILPHSKPDADALGSCLALSAFLQKFAHTVTVISPTEYPVFLSWMPGNDNVINYEQVGDEGVENYFKTAEIIFCLDFSALNRIEEIAHFFKKITAKIILIDHHLGKEDFADFEIWDTRAAATAELIYDFIQLIDADFLIDENIGECIYAGIMTDTGSFRHPSTTAHVHQIAAQLINKGVDTNKVHRLIFDNNTESRLKFIGYALCNKLVVMREYQAAYFTITQDELRQYKTVTGDTEGLVNYALSIEGINVAVLFKEDRDESIRMSFRSSGDISVRDMAAKYFNGGGHKNASGGKLQNKTIDESVALFRSVIGEFVKPKI